MPPLRDRDDDVLVLAHHFLRRMAAEMGIEIDGFDDEALACIQGYRWPGNVRELRNSVQRAVVATESSKIIRKDLPRRLQKVVNVTREVRFKLRRKLQDIEKAYVRQTLEECGGNKMETSRVLGISRKALYEKLARWKRDEEERDADEREGDVYSLGDEETTPITEPRPRDEEE